MHPDPIEIWSWNNEPFLPVEVEADVDVDLAAVVAEALLTRLVTAILHSSHCLSILSNILRAPVFVAVKQTKCKT